MTNQFFNHIIFSHMLALFVDEPPSCTRRFGEAAGGPSASPTCQNCAGIAGRPALLRDGKMTIQFYNHLVFSEMSALFVDHRSTASPRALGWPSAPQMTRPTVAETRSCSRSPCPTSFVHSRIHNSALESGRPPSFRQPNTHLPYDYPRLKFPQGNRRSQEARLAKSCT